MTYHSTVSGIAMLGLSGGLGDIDAPSGGDDLLIRWKTGPGINTQNAAGFLSRLRTELNNTRLFMAGPSVGWGSGGTFYARVKRLYDNAAMARQNQQNKTMQGMAIKMRDIGDSVVQGSGFTLDFQSLQNLDTDRVVEKVALPSRPRQPTASTPVTSAPPAAPPGEQLSTPPQAPASSTMTVKVLQQRLIASGARLRSGDDGRWGSGTKGALEAFASARGISLPTLGARSDYMQSGSNVTIPAALDAALPAPGGAPARRRPPRESREPADAAPPPASPPVPADGQQDGSAPPTGDSAEPWWKSRSVQIGAAVTTVIVVAVLISRKSN